MYKEKYRNITDDEWEDFLNGYFAQFAEALMSLAVKAQEIIFNESDTEYNQWIIQNKDILNKQYGAFVVKLQADFLSAQEYVKPSFDEQFVKFYEIVYFKLIKKLTSLVNTKQPSDKDEAERLIQKLSTLKPYDKRLAYLIYWNQARYYLLMDKPKESLKFYEHAFEAGKYRAGSELKDIIREGMVIAAKLDKKRLFKSMYKWA
ncbi:MAG: hypothetical protein GY730_07590, partial [bacterium]|nr:hypothetical protein [bacterium]